MTSIVHLAPPQARIVQAWRIDPAWVKRGVRAVYLPTMVVTPSGSFAYSARVGAARAIKTATANHPNASPLSTACGFFVVANLASTTPDALVIGRLRYNGSANFGAGLRFRQSALELNMGAGTGSWAYSDFNSGSVLTGRHSYAVKCVNSASAGWRDGVSLTPISTSDIISISGLDSGNVDIGQSTASGGTAVTAAVDGVIEIGMVLAPFAMTNDVIRLLHANPWRVLLPLAVEQPESTGGSTLTATLIEATAGTDLASASAVLSASLLDAAAGTDITSAQPTVARSLVDAAGGVDLVNSGVVVNGTLVEGVSAVDLSSALATLSVTVNEAVTVVELLAATRIANVAATEAAAGVDISSTGTSLSGSLVDAVVSADALSAAATLVASVLEAGGVVDQIHAAAQLVVLLTESAAGSDVVSRPAVYSVTATELVAALDVLSAAIEAAGLDPSARFTIAAKARRLTITAAARRLEIRK